MFDGIHRNAPTTTITPIDACSNEFVVQRRRPTTTTTTTTQRQQQTFLRILSSVVRTHHQQPWGRDRCSNKSNPVAIETVNRDHILWIHPTKLPKEQFLLQTALRDKMKESLDIVVLLGCCHLSQNARHLVHLRITRRSGFSSHLIEDFLCFGGV